MLTIFYVEVTKVEALENVYKIKTLNAWEVEKGDEVVSLHVVVKKDTDSTKVQQQIKNIMGVNECTIQLIYLS